MPIEDLKHVQDELNIIAPAVPDKEAPKSVDEVIAGLRGFGIEEFEEVLTVRTKAGRTLRLKIANVPTTDEMLSVQAADEFKGYLWMKRVKVELLSRSISWIDGINLRELTGDKRFVQDPTDGGALKDVQAALRNIIMGWGQEVVEVLWKVLMNHSQNIEDRLREDFPNDAKFTEVEQRLFDRARKQMEEQTQTILEQQVSALYDTTPEPVGAEDAKKS
jgi:hypothetical protein